MNRCAVREALWSFICRDVVWEKLSRATNVEMCSERGDVELL